MAILMCFVTQLVRAQTPQRTDDERATAYFRMVAALVGKPTAELKRVWPTPVGSGMLDPLRLSAAAQLQAMVGRNPLLRDDVTRLLYVRLVLQLPDTTSLQRRVSELSADLTRAHGAPRSCELPLGPPRHLYAVQDVVRSWVVNGEQQAELEWSVTPERQYFVSVTYNYTDRPLERLAVECTRTIP
jgi:hypothetical protein